MYDFPIGSIRLPDFNTAVDGIFTNLHGWWEPPEEVLVFWSTSCYVKYDPDTFEAVKKKVIDSYMEAVWDYWKMYTH